MQYLASFAARNYEQRQLLVLRAAELARYCIVLASPCHVTFFYNSKMSHQIWLLFGWDNVFPL